MDKEPEIRKARLCDVSAIQNCVEAAYQHYINRIGKPPGPMLDDYAEVIEHHKVFVAETEKYCWRSCTHSEINWSTFR